MYDNWQNKPVRVYDDVLEESKTIISLSGYQRLQESLLKNSSLGVYRYILRGNDITILKTSPVRLVNNYYPEHIDKLTSAKKFQGEISRRSQKKITDIIDNWGKHLEYNNIHVDSLGKKRRRKLVFITLTLPTAQKQNDQDFKRNCLNPLLQWLRDMPEKPLYLWKAESQKNGNIHFHLIIDCYIDKEVLQKKWNKILWNACEATDYDTFDNTMKAPSTKIELPKSLKNIRAYLAKYVAKNEFYRPIEGRIWGCSRQLTEFQNVKIFIDVPDALKITAEIAPNLKSIYLHECFVTVSLDKLPEVKPKLNEYYWKYISEVQLIGHYVEAIRNEERGDFDGYKTAYYITDNLTGEVIKEFNSTTSSIPYIVKYCEKISNNLEVIQKY